MHGAVHDFVVINTLKDGRSYPTGHGGNDNVAGDFVPHFKSPEKDLSFEKVLEIVSLDICGSMKTYDFVGKGPKWVEKISCKSYVGIDITPGNCVDFVMDAHNLEFKAKTYDLILCLEMLEHDTDPQQTLKEAYRVLKDGGLFLFSTVDETHPEHGSGPGGFYRHLTEKELKGWLTKAGFEFDLVHVGTDLFVKATK